MITRFRSNDKILVDKTSRFYDADYEKLNFVCEHFKIDYPTVLINSCDDQKTELEVKEWLFGEGYMNLIRKEFLPEIHETFDPIAEILRVYNQIEAKNVCNS